MSRGDYYSSSGSYSTEDSSSSSGSDRSSRSEPRMSVQYPRMFGLIPLPRRVLLRSRIITYIDSDNPNPYQPTPSSYLDELTDPSNRPNPYRRNTHSTDESTLWPSQDSGDTYSTTSSLPTESSSPNTTSSIPVMETRFLGFETGRETLELYANPQNLPERFYMLTEHELRGLDAEIYGHLDPGAHGLTFSRWELRQLFAEAEFLWGTPPLSPNARVPSSSSSISSDFSWESTERLQERQRVDDAWEEIQYRLLPSPGPYDEFFARGQLVDEPEVRRVEPTRTSRRRHFDEVDPDSDDEAEAEAEAEALGRSRRRADSPFGDDAARPERAYRGSRRTRSQSFYEKTSLQEMDERLRLARERRAAEAEAARVTAAAEGQLQQTVQTLRDEGFFGQARTAAELRARLPNASDARISAYVNMWHLMVLSSHERRSGVPYTADELRADYYAEAVIEMYLGERLTEAMWRAWVQQLNLRGLEEAGFLRPEATADDMQGEGLTDGQIAMVLERNRETGAVLLARMERERAEEVEAMRAAFTLDPYGEVYIVSDLRDMGLSEEEIAAWEVERDMRALRRFAGGVLPPHQLRAWGFSEATIAAYSAEMEMEG